MFAMLRAKKITIYALAYWTILASLRTASAAVNLVDSATPTTTPEDNATDAVTASETAAAASLDEYTPPSERPETVTVTVLFAIIFVVGVLGNGTLVIIFFRHRSMRNIPNTYILSLALADLLVIIVCVPLASIVYTQESWTFGVDLCRISESFKDISIGVSVFTLTALSGERYCAIVNPLRKLQTKPLTVFTATMIWLLAILLATPSFIVSDVQHITIDEKLNKTILVCSPFGQHRDNFETYARYTVLAKACIYYLLPLTIIGVLYILMAKRLHISARDMPGEVLSTQSRSQVRARRHVARMVVAFVLIFFACFFPYHVFELWYHFYPSALEVYDEIWHTIRIIGFCTSFMHSCVNPVALYCVSGVFRQHFNRYLCCWCVKRTPRIRQHSTATGMMDTHTSIMSVRRSTNYNRASMHVHNNNSTVGGVIGGGGGYHRNVHQNNGTVGAGNGSGGGVGVGVAADGSANAETMAQSMIMQEKRRTTTPLLPHH